MKEERNKSRKKPMCTQGRPMYRVWSTVAECELIDYEIMFSAPFFRALFIEHRKSCKWSFGSLPLSQFAVFVGGIPIRKVEGACFGLYLVIFGID
jgi:hypothetical protein